MATQGICSSGCLQGWNLGVWETGREGELLFITHSFEFCGYIYSLKINTRILLRKK